MLSVTLLYVGKQCLCCTVSEEFSLVESEGKVGSSLISFLRGSSLKG